MRKFCFKKRINFVRRKQLAVDIKNVGRTVGQGNFAQAFGVGVFIVNFVGEHFDFAVTEGGNDFVCITDVVRVVAGQNDYRRSFFLEDKISAVKEGSGATGFSFSGSLSRKEMNTTAAMTISVNISFFTILFLPNMSIIADG